MNTQYIIQSINKIIEFQDHFKLTVIVNSKIELEKLAYEYSSKMKWYVTTAELILNQDKNLTMTEKEEFLKMHIYFTKTFNEKGEKINIDFITKNTVS